MKHHILFQARNLCTIAVLYAVISPYVSAIKVVLQ